MTGCGVSGVASVPRCDFGFGVGGGVWAAGLWGILPSPGSSAETLSSSPGVAEGFLPRGREAGLALPPLPDTP